MISLFAAGMYGYSIVDVAVFVVVVAAIVALVYIALRQFGVAIPAWVQQVFWVCVVAFVIIVAIRFVAGM